MNLPIEMKKKINVNSLITFNEPVNFKTKHDKYGKIVNKYNKGTRLIWPQNTFAILKSCFANKRQYKNQIRIFYLTQTYKRNSSRDDNDKKTSLLE